MDPRTLPEPSARGRPFARGLRPGETLYVTHGFAVGPDSREYMWLVVQTWEGSRIRGQLVNTARDRDDLKAGQAVELQDVEVFDWMIELPDGEQDGGYTTRAALAEGLSDPDAGD